MKIRRLISGAVIAAAITLAYIAGTQQAFTPPALAQMTPTPSPTPTAVPPVTPAPY
jgi:hypothetical protein